MMNKKEYLLTRKDVYECAHYGCGLHPEKGYRFCDKHRIMCAKCNREEADILFPSSDIFKQDMDLCFKCLDDVKFFINTKK
jgi:hypothetical protein